MEETKVPLMSIKCTANE